MSASLPHLGFPLLLSRENCFWCLLVPHSYQRQMTSWGLSFSLLSAALWPSLRSKPGLECLPVKLGVNSKGGPALSLPSHRPIHWEHQDPGKCILIHCPYLWHSSNPFHGLSFRKPIMKQNILGAVIKCKLISIEILSPFLFIPCGLACFHLNWHIYSSFTRWQRKRKDKYSCFPLRVFLF